MGQAGTRTTLEGADRFAGAREIAAARRQVNVGHNCKDCGNVIERPLDPCYVNGWHRWIEVS